MLTSIGKCECHFVDRESLLQAATDARHFASSDDEKRVQAGSVDKKKVHALSSIRNQGSDRRLPVRLQMDATLEDRGRRCRQTEVWLVWEDVETGVGSGMKVVQTSFSVSLRASALRIGG